MIGTTARKRIIKSEYIELKKLPGFLKERSNEYRKIALVFGREESGLSNEEIGLCDITSSISMASAYPSLNLAQAVMIYSYMLSDTGTSNDQNIAGQSDSKSLRLLKDKIDLLLEGTKISNNSTLKGRIMERLSLAPGKDIRLMHSITNSLINKYIKRSK